LLAAFGEVAALAWASGIAVPDDVVDKIRAYATRIPAATRSSLQNDLSQGRRLELESLAGSVVRRAAALGVPTPIMRTLYAVLKPYAHGRPSES
jgi:2-dehydropantoate 2-reductase